MTIRNRFLALLLGVCALMAAGAVTAAGNPADPDPTFGNYASFGKGWQLIPVMEDQFVVAVVPFGGGILVCMSEEGGAGGQLIRLTKRHADGTLDTSWGTNGHVVKDAYLYGVADMILDKQGRIVVVGATPAGGGGYHMAVVRFKADGTDDASFAGDGGLAVSFNDWDGSGNPFVCVAQSAIALPSGSLIVVGNVLGTGGWTGGTAFISADGNTAQPLGDMRFETGRPAVVNRILEVASIPEMPQGGYVVAGASQNSAGKWRFGAALLKKDHTPLSITTWAFQGDGQADEIVSDLTAVDATHLLVAGTTNDRMAALRLQILDDHVHPIHLALDTSFVGNSQAGYFGYRYVSPETGVPDVPVSGLRPFVRSLQDASGRVLLAATIPSPVIPNVYLGLASRLDAAGQPDVGFGSAGSASYRFPVSETGFSSLTAFTAMMLQGEKPVLAGIMENPDLISPESQL